MYGIPLKVAPPELTRKEKDEVEKLEKKREALGEKLRTPEVTEGEQEKKIKEELEDIKSGRGKWCWWEIHCIGRSGIDK
jgi:hypothetical protein